MTGIVPLQFKIIFRIKPVFAVLGDFIFEMFKQFQIFRCFSISYYISCGPPKEGQLLLARQYGPKITHYHGFLVGSVPLIMLHYSSILIPGSRNKVVVLLHPNSEQARVATYNVKLEIGLWEILAC